MGAIFYRLRWPAPATRWLAIALSLTLAIAVSFGLRFLASLAVFWTIQRRGVWAAHSALLLVLSGFILPLAFYPHWAATILRALPWASAVQAPIDVFLDRRPWPGVVALQLAWAIALLALGRAVTRAAHGKLVVQGG